MVNQLSSETNLVKLEASSKTCLFDAMCTNCNKRFKSMRAVSMHLRVTGARHKVNVINHGYYDKKTGLKLVAAISQSLECQELRALAVSEDICAGSHHKVISRTVSAFEGLLLKPIKGLPSI
jgi:hypothetical protein